MSKSRDDLKIILQKSLTKKASPKFSNPCELVISFTDATHKVLNLYQEAKNVKTFMTETTTNKISDSSRSSEWRGYQN